MKATFLQSTDLLFVKSWCTQSQQTLSLNLEDCRISLHTHICVHMYIYIYMCLHTYVCVYIYICIYLHGN